MNNRLLSTRCSLVLGALAVLIVAGAPRPASASDSETTDRQSGDDAPSTESSKRSNDASPDDALAVPSLEAPAHRPAELRVALGPLTALRSMRFEGDGGQIRHRPAPYIGATLSVTGRLAFFEKLEAYLMVDADLGYGVARNRELLADRAPGAEAPGTEMTFGGVRLSLRRQIAPTVVLGVGAGLQATSFTVDPNPVYTGHRYIAPDLAVQMQWFALEEVLAVGVDVGAYPVLATNNSDGAHGTATSFGMRAEGRFTWRPFTGAADEAVRGLGFLARYRFQRFRTQFPTSPIGSRGGISEDNQHIIGLMVGYEL